MIQTVRDLIDALKKLDENKPICIRKSLGDGYFSDWKLHKPTEFYPGGKICLSAFEQYDDEEKTGKS